VTLLRSSLFGPLQLRRCLEWPDACPLRRDDDETVPHDVRFRCQRIDQTASAAGWLAASMTHTDDMTLMRQIVAEDGWTIAWLSDAQVVDLVAAKVARRDLCLLVAERTASGARMSGLARVMAAAGIAETPSMLRSRPDSDDPRQAVAAMSEFADDMDQAMQAAVLQEAARDGVPFCEMCEKARRAAQSSSASSPA
jgi:hypothetical protein